MQKTLTLERAIVIATEAHAGQIDRAGASYVLHPLRVMLAVSTEAERIVGVLHDVVEDTDVTMEQLRAEGLTDEFAAALDAVTKWPGETRMQAAARAAADPIARAVKLADNLDNMDLGRISQPTAKDVARLEEYRAVREFLLKA